MRLSFIKKVYGVLLFLIAFPPGIATAQDYYFRHLTTRGGMVGAYINEIIQDDRGFIWFATETGLSKFDGYTFTNYRSTSEFTRQLSNNNVLKLELLPENRLLIAHASGIDLLQTKTETFRSLALEASLPPFSSVVDMHFDSNKDLWVISGQYLYHFSKPDFNSDSLRGIAYHQEIGDVGSFRSMEFYRGEIWLGSTQGIFIFNPGSKMFREITSSDPSVSKISETITWEVKTGPDGNLYMTFLDGFLRYNYSSNQLENLTDLFQIKPEDLESVNFQDLFLDNENNVWIGTNSIGAYRWNMFTDELKLFEPSFNNENTVNSGDVHHIYQDSQNNIWFGYHSLGTSLMYSQSWNYSFQLPFPELPENDPKNNLTDVMMDQKSIIWAVTEGGLIKGLGANNPVLYEYDWDDLGALTAAANTILAVTEQHVYLHTGNNDITQLIAFDIQDESYHLIGADFDLNNIIGLEPKKANDLLYMGVFNDRKMIELNTQNWELEFLEVPESTDTSNYTFRVYFPDYITDSQIFIKEFMVSQNRAKLGTYILDRAKRSIQAYELELEGSLNGVNAPVISAYSPGLTYFNTLSGLIQVDNRNNTTQLLFEDQAPLLREGNLLMTEDNQGYIWLTNQTGVMRLDPFTESISYFEVPSEKRPSTLSIPKTLPNGEIIFPGEGGYIRFNPAELQTSKPLGEIIITSLQTLEDTYQTIYDTEEIEVESGSKSLTFNYVGMNFRDPSSTQYRYRILGSENEQWNDVGSQRSVFIPNLTSGSYTFEVQSGSQIGSYNEKSASLSFSILPPWWNTIPAYLAYVLLLGAFIYSVDRFQRRRLTRIDRERNQEKELKHAREIEKAYENLKAAQEQLVQQEKLASLGQLTAGIAHEIKNPLNFVNNFSDLSVELIQEALEELEKYPSESKEIDHLLADIASNLKKIHGHGTRADSIVQSMLQHSRGGTGKMEATDLNALIKEYTNLSFHGMRAGKDPINVYIHYELDDSIKELPLITEDFSRVIINLANNAFDAMREKLNRTDEKGDYSPQLKVVTRKKDKHLTIEFVDNGPGIPDEMKDQILQPFFTTKKGTDGTGLGLSITNDIIKAHGGTLDVESKQSVGSTFIIQLQSTI